MREKAIDMIQFSNKYTLHRKISAPISFFLRWQRANSRRCELYRSRVISFNTTMSDKFQTRQNHLQVYNLVCSSSVAVDDLNLNICFHNYNRSRLIGLGKRMCIYEQQFIYFALKTSKIKHLHVQCTMLPYFTILLYLHYTLFSLLHIFFNWKCFCNCDYLICINYYHIVCVMVMEKNL